MPRRAPPGGCFTAEDPELDGRIAQPRWLNNAAVSLVPSPPQHPDTSRFNLWAIPGRKHLFQQGAGLQLWAPSMPSIAQWRLAPELADSDPFAYVLAADQQLNARLMAVREASMPYESTRPAHGDGTKSRPSRMHVVHVRALQVFDGTVSGASQRDIAEVLFGAEAIARCWSSDSELRAQVRHLVKRAKYYVNGGYLELIKQSDRQGR
jgi:hypothetical protein